MSEHTPGPWTYVPLTDACRRNPLRHFCIHTSRLATDDEREANARLMASSPTMLSALQAVEHLFAPGSGVCITTIGPSTREARELIDQTFQKVEDALHAAKGASPDGHPVNRS